MPKADIGSLSQLNVRFLSFRKGIFIDSPVIAYLTKKNA